MTPARSPLQELAEVIRGATGRHNAIIIAGDPEVGDRHEYVARAVAAHLSRPETIERMKGAHKAEAERWAIDSGIAGHQAVFEWPADVPVDTGGLSAMEFIDRKQMRAAVAAVVGEGV